MIILLYNIIQLTTLALFWPVLLVFVITKAKYRRRLPARLGFRLTQKLSNKNCNQPTFWIHGLSVGEITSAVPLAAGIRKKYPDSRIVVSASTETGEAIANRLLGDIADHIISSPLDMLPVVTHFIKHIQPSLFILIETDFWPNLLATLSRHKIPTLLVNGRISQKSFHAYHRFYWFFVPMFRKFNQICMQTETDKEHMKALLGNAENMHTLGNLKYDTPIEAFSESSGIAQLLPDNRLIFIAGSTHHGEEQIIFRAYRKLRDVYPEIYLVIAPRNPKRADEILQLGKEFQLQGDKRTRCPEMPKDYLIVDTIGELVGLYRFCHIAFIGGSFVTGGGHNPIEPALMSIPVLFGPHMEDFQKIASDLVAAGGAVSLSTEQQLASTLECLVMDESRRRHMGMCGNMCITSQQGVIARHTDLIASLL